MKNIWKNRRKAIGKIMALVKLHSIKTDFLLGMFEGFDRIFKLISGQCSLSKETAAGCVLLKRVFLKIS